MQMFSQISINQLVNQFDLFNICLSSILHDVLYIYIYIYIYHGSGDLTEQYNSWTNSFDSTNTELALVHRRISNVTNARYLCIYYVQKQHNMNSRVIECITTNCVSKHFPYFYCIWIQKKLFTCKTLWSICVELYRSLINEFIKFTRCKGKRKESPKGKFVFAWTLYVSTHYFWFTITF